MIQINKFRKDTLNTLRHEIVEKFGIDLKTFALAGDYIDVVANRRIRQVICDIETEISHLQTELKIANEVLDECDDIAGVLTDMSVYDCPEEDGL